MCKQHFMQAYFPTNSLPDSSWYGLEYVLPKGFKCPRKLCHYILLYFLHGTISLQIILLAVLRSGLLHCSQCPELDSWLCHFCIWVVQVRYQSRFAIPPAWTSSQKVPADPCKKCVMHTVAAQQVLSFSDFALWIDRTFGCGSNALEGQSEALVRPWQPVCLMKGVLYW